MDYRERWEDQQEALLAMLDGFAARNWSMQPGFIESFDQDKITCSVQLAIMGRVQLQPATGTPAASGAPPVYKWTKLPLLVDCPVIYLRGGGFAVTTPLVPGDEVAVFFADRCIDGWWSSGQVSPQSEIRFHDLSDGFVLPGPCSQPNVLPNGVSTTSLQVRNKAGTAYYELTNSEVANIVAPNGVNISALAGEVSVTAEEQINLVAPVELNVQSALASFSGDIVAAGTIEAIGGFVTTAGEW